MAIAIGAIRDRSGPSNGKMFTCTTTNVILALLTIPRMKKSLVRQHRMPPSISGAFLQVAIGALFLPRSLYARGDRSPTDRTPHVEFGRVDFPRSALAMGTEVIEVVAGKTQALINPEKKRRFPIFQCPAGHSDRSCRIELVGCL